MSASDSVPPFHGVWKELGKLRERLALTGHDVTAEATQLLEAIAEHDEAWRSHRRMTDIKFYDDLYVMVRRFGSYFGSSDPILKEQLSEVLKVLVEAKKTLIQRVEGATPKNP